MADTLTAISAALAGAVRTGGRAVVAVEARERGSSGIHWTQDVIVTADHTLRRTEDITLKLPDGRQVAAAVAGRDGGTDVAVLKAGLAGVPVAERAPAPAQPGQLALVVGRLPEIGASASMGVISAVGERWRTWRGGLIDSYVRLDAAVYPGTSGGAVVDAEGRLIGMATGGLSRVAGVAVPLATLERVVGELLATGRVSRGYLGVGLQPVELPGGQRGLIVLTVEPDGPAAQGGVLIGDILVALDGAPVSDTDAVQAALQGEAIGRTLRAGIVRGGEPREIALKVGERRRT